VRWPGPASWSGDRAKAEDEEDLERAESVARKESMSAAAFAQQVAGLRRAGQKEPGAERHGAARAGARHRCYHPHEQGAAAKRQRGHDSMRDRVMRLTHRAREHDSNPGGHRKSEAAPKHRKFSCQLEQNEQPQRQHANKTAQPRASAVVEHGGYVLKVRKVAASPSVPVGGGEE